jgi:hypothetical protein
MRGIEEKEMVEDVTIDRDRARLADALNVPFLRDQLSLGTLAQLTAVSKEVRDVVEYSDQWRLDFSKRICTPLTELREPKPGVTFKALSDGYFASLKRATGSAVTPHEKSRLITYKSYIHPIKFIDHEKIITYDLLVPALYFPRWSRAKVAIRMAGVAACIVGAAALGAFFLSGEAILSLVNASIILVAFGIMFVLSKLDSILSLFQHRHLFDQDLS